MSTWHIAIITLAAIATGINLVHRNGLGVGASIAALVWCWIDYCNRIA